MQPQSYGYHFRRDVCYVDVLNHFRCFSFTCEGRVVYQVKYRAGRENQPSILLPTATISPTKSNSDPRERELSSLIKINFLAGWNFNDEKERASWETDIPHVH